MFQGPLKSWMYEPYIYYVFPPYRHTYDKIYQFKTTNNKIDQLYQYTAIKDL